MVNVISAAAVPPSVPPPLIFGHGAIFFGNSVCYALPGCGSREWRYSSIAIIHPTAAAADVVQGMPVLLYGGPMFCVRFVCFFFSPRRKHVKQQFRERDLCLSLCSIDFCFLTWTTGAVCACVRTSVRVRCLPSNPPPNLPNITQESTPRHNHFGVDENHICRVLLVALIALCLYLI